MHCCGICGKALALGDICSRCHPEEFTSCRVCRTQIRVNARHGKCVECSSKDRAFYDNGLKQIIDSLPSTEEVIAKSIQFPENTSEEVKRYIIDTYTKYYKEHQQMLINILIYGKSCEST